MADVANPHLPGKSTLRLWFGALLVLGAMLPGTIVIPVVRSFVTASWPGSEWLMHAFIAVNLLALFLYPLAGPAIPLVFWAINGFLLGREYFTLVALRRLPPAEAKAMRRRNGLRLWLAGTLMAAPLSVPVLNLVIPVLGVATFTHLFHRLAAAGR